MQTAILYPVFVQIFLTLFVGGLTGFGRVKMVRSGQVHPSQIALDNRNWPDDLRKLGNNYSNQFERPVLFYVLCIIALLVNMADMIAILLAWLFVASRLVHAYIHTTQNRVPRRGLVFFFGAFAVGLLALYLFLRQLLAGVQA
jgi:hypothetical protein